MFLSLSLSLVCIYIYIYTHTHTHTIRGSHKHMTLFINNHSIITITSKASKIFYRRRSLSTFDIPPTDLHWTMYCVHYCRISGLFLTDDHRTLKRTNEHANLLSNILSELTVSKYIVYFSYS